MSAHAGARSPWPRATPRAALVALRRAWQAWQELEAPYEAARARVLVGLACRSLGDEDTAALELEAARGVFAELEATRDVGWVDSLSPAPRLRMRTGSPRVSSRCCAWSLPGRATARSRRRSSSASTRSARHLQNIFAKLRVSSRTAAGAFAFEHDLV